MHPGRQQNGYPTEEASHRVGLCISAAVKWYTTELKLLI